jgi:hypothetical protein
MNEPRALSCSRGPALGWRAAFSALVAAVAVAAALGGCGKGDKPEVTGERDGEKHAHEAAIADLRQPIALIAGYTPYAHYPENPDKYFPVRHPDWEKSTLLAANEIRYAANKARQKLEASSAEATKGVQAALGAVTGACADADDPDKLAKCTAAVTGLDAALEKASTVASVMGVTGKYPRIAPDSVTDEARTAMASFLKARGPGPNEKTFIEKRSDAKATPAEVMAACQSADDDASSAAQAFQKADEPVRLVAATRKMALDSQCRRLGEIDGLAKELAGCRKKPKSADCKATCGKMKIWVDDGFPAAAFAPVAKDFADICGN